MPMEVQVHLARFMADERRREPRNVGILVRTADDRFLYRFIGFGTDEPVPEWLKKDEGAYRDNVREWLKVVEKYGQKALAWVGKRSRAKDKRFFVELGFSEMVDTFDFDRLFEEIVL